MSDNLDIFIDRGDGCKRMGASVTNDNQSSAKKSPTKSKSPIKLKSPTKSKSPTKQPIRSSPRLHRHSETAETPVEVENVTEPEVKTRSSRRKLSINEETMNEQELAAPQQETVKDEHNEDNSAEIENPKKEKKSPKKGKKLESNNAETVEESQEKEMEVRSENKEVDLRKKEKNRKWRDAAKKRKKEAEKQQESGAPHVAEDDVTASGKKKDVGTITQDDKKSTREKVDVSGKKKKRKKNKGSNKIENTKDVTTVEPAESRKRKKKPKKDKDESRKRVKRIHGIETEVTDVDNQAELDADEDELEQIVLGLPSAKSRMSKILGARDSSSDESDDNDDAPMETSSKQPVPVRQPVWVDEDEDDTPVVMSSKPMTKSMHTMLDRTDDAKEKKISAAEYEKRLRRAFEKTQPVTAGGQTPKWAQLDDASNKKKKPTRTKFDDSDTETDRESVDGENSGDEAATLLSRTAGQYIGKSPYLPKGTLAFKRLKDLTFGRQVNTRVINNVQFHPQLPVAIVAGKSTLLQLFKIDGKDNDLLQSAIFEGFPICTAKLLNHDQVIVSSPVASYLYAYNMTNNKTDKIRIDSKALSQKHRNVFTNFEVSPHGDVMAVYMWDGMIHLISTNSYEWLGSMKQNSNINCLAFSHNRPERMYSHGDDGRVHIWDIRQRSCVKQFYDDGCVKGTAVTESPDGRYLACGSNTGVVNVYDACDLNMPGNPKPSAVMTNLTTAADCLRFNHNSEILAASSSAKENHIKFFHTRSHTVFGNFTGPATNLREITTMDFSPHSGYFMCGSMHGKVPLYNLSYYSSY